MMEATFLYWLAILSFSLASSIYFYLLPKMRAHDKNHVVGLIGFGLGYTLLGVELWSHAETIQYESVHHIFTNLVFVASGYILTTGYVLVKMRNTLVSKLRSKGSNSGSREDSPSD